MNEEIIEQIDMLMEPINAVRRHPDVEDIFINKPGEVFIRGRGKSERQEIALDFDDLYDIAVLVGALTRQNVSERSPLLSSEVPDRGRLQRLQVVMPPCVPPGTISFSLRVPGKNVAAVESIPERYDLSRWNKWEARKENRRADLATLLTFYDSGDVVGFFREIVRLRFNPLLCGHTGAGKSTFLKTLMSLVTPSERVITIENTLEVDIVNQPNHVRLMYSHGDQGESGVTQTQLLQAYLRMRPDRGCVGELRDPEAGYTYVSEIMTGHPGSPSTIHGKSASQAATRLFNLVKSSPEGSSIDADMVLKLLGLAVDVIIPFNETDGVYSMGEVWFAADAERRGATIRELME